MIDVLIFLVSTTLLVVAVVVDRSLATLSLTVDSLHSMTKKEDRL